MRGVLECTPLKALNEFKVSGQAVPLLYNHSSFRTHLDNRASIKVLAVHDFLGSSNFWQNAFHKTITTLPLSTLMIKEPLEVYSVDLRGHNASEKLMSNSDEENYLSLCAEDVIRLQREVVVCAARGLGVGFGAMVASLAALHAPDSFHSLTLLVENFAQLFRCDPNAYVFREVLQGAPSDAKNISDMHAFLKTKLPHPLDREVLLGFVKESRGGARFRFHERLLKMENAIQMPIERLDNLQYHGAVKVIIYGGPDPSKEEVEAFKYRFPNATFHCSERADRGFFDSVHIGKIFLNALDIVGSMEIPEEAEGE
ncbi:unnamed protein product [Phytomonas sp. EM1]|nr:unnamed protein product [Phytomonas sp. EM1]|eukprot:CCW59869.1 unnamed protein product [Phytomonas sp. isolate EM1]